MHFKDMPIWGQLILVFVLVGLIGFGGYKYWPAIEKIKKNIKKEQATLDKLEDEIRKGRMLEKKLPELQARIAQLEKDLDDLKSIIPEFKDDSELLKRFKNLADRSRLDLPQLSPGKLTKREFYREYPFKLNVLGSYHDLAKFFDRLSKQSRIFNVEDVKIDSIAGRSRSGHSIKASFTATTFIYEETIPAASGKKQKSKSKKGR